MAYHFDDVALLEERIRWSLLLVCGLCAVFPLLYLVYAVRFVGINCNVRFHIPSFLWSMVPVTVRVRLTWTLILLLPDSEHLVRFFGTSHNAGARWCCASGLQSSRTCQLVLFLFGGRSFNTGYQFSTVDSKYPTEFYLMSWAQRGLLFVFSDLLPASSFIPVLSTHCFQPTHVEPNTVLTAQLYRSYKYNSFKFCTVHFVAR